MLLGEKLVPSGTFGFEAGSDTCIMYSLVKLV
jgi:hypothetical protein